MNKIAIIGGSGVYKLESFTIKNEIYVDTPYGRPSDKILELELNSNNEKGNESILFLARHGRKHDISPSEINYRANIFALKKLGVNAIISISAVGSLKEELPPKTFFIPDQFIDFTKGLRKRTFFSEGIVGHVSCALPVNRNLVSGIQEALKSTTIKHAAGGSYICIEGPQFSTKAESSIYRNFGASVIGMTNVPEVFLAKEANIPYATIAMVTDYDCWREGHCTLQEIMEVMKENYLSVQALLKFLIPIVSQANIEPDNENKNAVVTSTDKINLQHQEILKVLHS